jgi:hypothetical protein
MSQMQKQDRKMMRQKDGLPQPGMGWFEELTRGNQRTYGKLGPTSNHTDCSNGTIFLSHHFLSATAEYYRWMQGMQFCW